jgi:hypothetical protein
MDLERAAYAASSHSVNGDGGERLTTEMMRLRPHTYTGAVAAVALCIP